jgi:hypothetical protein
VERTDVLNDVKSHVGKVGSVVDVDHWQTTGRPLATMYESLIVSTCNKHKDWLSINLFVAKQFGANRKCENMKSSLTRNLINDL